MIQQKFFLDGAAGRLEAVACDPGIQRRGIALVAHPHPLHGGTMENKVVQTLAKAFAELGWLAVRMNFRGVGQSAGDHDAGLGETEDMLVLAAHFRHKYEGLPMLLAGFSFGAYVQLRVAGRLAVEKLVLVAPAVANIEAGAVPSDTLVIHGEVDEIVPLTTVFDWARPLNLPVTVLPGVGHFFHGQLLQLKKIVMNSCRC